MAEKTPERKAFNWRLAAASENAQLEYYNILTDEQARRAKDNNGKPVVIGVEERESFLDKATRIALFGSADPQRMERDWEAATSKDGRPPIGGAQDD